MQQPDLPRWPSGGNRRELDRLWVAEVERHGRPALVPEPGEAPLELYQGIEEFNYGRFWDCHESLETVWRQTPYPLRLFYHAIIKAAVGFHHLGRHNRHGARSKLADAVELLGLFQPAFMGVRTDQLLEDTQAWLERVDREGRVPWAELDLLPKPRIAVERRRG